MDEDAGNEQVLQSESQSACDPGSVTENREKRWAMRAPLNSESWASIAWRGASCGNGRRGRRWSAIWPCGMTTIHSSGRESRAIRDRKNGSCGQQGPRESHAQPGVQPWPASKCHRYDYTGVRCGCSEDEGDGRRKHKNEAETHWARPRLTSGPNGSPWAPGAEPSLHQDACGEAGLGGDGGDDGDAVADDAGPCCPGANWGCCESASDVSVHRNEKTFCCIQDTGRHEASRPCECEYAASGARADGKPCHREGICRDEGVHSSTRKPERQEEARWV